MKKTIDSAWNIISVNKTTYWPDWKIIHIKDKIEKYDETMEELNIIIEKL